jgi:dipeptidase
MLLFIMPDILADEPYSQDFDCFSILAGKKATADGSVILAHNEDTGTELVNYYKVPAREHTKGKEIFFETGGKMPQVEKTFAYLWVNLPVCDVCDSYMNEYGVTIGSDGCPSREDNPDLTNGGIVFWVRRTVAERARTAREGVMIAGELIERYGYASSGRTYLIADANEGWMLAAVNGRHWVAQRVPDDEIAVIPNNYTIQEVNLGDTANFLGSPDLVDYAVSRGWYNPSTDGEFNFAKAYSNPGSLTHPVNVNRMWRAVNLLSEIKYDITETMPFSFKPSKKVAIQDIMTVLRDHCDGTAFDKSDSHPTGSPYYNVGAICGPGTQYSVVAHLRGWLPQDIANVMWIAPFRPDVQVYTAWYPSITSVPELYAKGDWESALNNHFDIKARGPEKDKMHAFRVFVSLADSVEKDYKKRVLQVNKAWKPVELQIFRQQEQFEQKMSALSDPEERLKAITKYTSDKSLVICRKAEKISGKLK